MGNKLYNIDTTIIDIYMLNDDIIGVKCNPNPNSLMKLYKNTPFYDKSSHEQYDDLFLDKNKPDFNDISKILKVGNTYNISYNHILTKNFDDELNYKRDRDDNINLKDIINNYKLKTINYRKRIYTNYITNIRPGPTYKAKLTIYKIISSPYDGYYELDPFDYTPERFLITTQMGNEININGDYILYYKKSNLGDNFYVVVNYKAI